MYEKTTKKSSERGSGISVLAARHDDDDDDDDDEMYISNQDPNKWTSKGRIKSYNLYEIAQ